MKNDLIKDYLEKHKMTITQLAKQCNICPNTMRRIANANISNLRGNTLIKIVLGMNISADDLLKSIFSK